jgi:beta-lactamase regulating signal transducer with metallopeptidase domain
MSSSVISTWSLFWIDSLWRASWQGAIFILLVWAVCRLFPRLPASLCAWLWWLACLKLLCALVWIAPPRLVLLPAVPRPAAIPAPAPWPSHAPLSVRVEPTAHAPARVAPPHRAPDPPQPGAPAARTGPGVPAAPPAPRHSRVPELLLALWLAGLAWRLAGMLRQWWAARRLAREALPLEDRLVQEQAAELAAALGLRRCAPLREAAAAPGPLVLGFPRPAILLPPGLADRLSRDELRLALAHEVAHVARGDLWLSMVPALTHDLFFFHPLVGLACREWATAREAACDAAALALTGAPAPAYGRLLLKLATAGRGPGIAPALGASLRAETLQRRIARLRQLGSPSPRRRGIGLALLAIVGAVGVIPWRLTAADPAPRERAVLTHVPGLEKRVTYTETKTPLSELVRKVAADTGVLLSAAPEVANEPVAVVVKDYPARELLEQVAELLDYQWSRRRFRHAGPNGGEAVGFEIYQDLASRQREEAARAAALAGIELRFRDELARSVALASGPPEEIDRILDEELKRDEAFRQMAPDQKQAAIRVEQHPSPEQQERERRRSAASSVDSPVPRALARLVGRLSEAQWRRLWAGQQLIFSSRPQPGELRLPSETEETFRHSKPALSSRLYGGVLSQMPDFAEFQGHQSAMLERWNAATDYRVTILLQADRFDMNTPIRLTAGVVPLRSGGPGSGSAFWGVSNAFSINTFAGLNNTPGDVDNPERRARLEQDPVVGVKKPFRPQAPLHVDVLGPNSGTMVAWRDLLPGIARTYGVQIISDAYWKSSGLIGSERVGVSGPTSLFVLLDRRAHIQSWDQSGRLIRLRSRTWFFDRPREIPLRLVRRWQALIDQKGALPLEEYAAIATGLTDAQRDGLFDLAMQAGLSDDLRGLQWDPFTLQLYASLAPAQRQALWRGAAVLVVQMTPAQRDLFQQGLEMVQGRGTVSRPEELAAACLSIAAEPTLRIVTTRGGASTERLEPESAAQVTNTAARSPSPAVPAPGNEKHYRVLRISFQFQIGPGKPAAWPLTVAAPDRP